MEFMRECKPTEDTRVKLPALFHTTRLGYNYVSLKNYLKEDKKIDAETNIFIDIRQYKFTQKKKEVSLNLMSFYHHIYSK